MRNKKENGQNLFFFYVNFFFFLMYGSSQNFLSEKKIGYLLFYFIFYNIKILL